MSIRVRCSKCGRELGEQGFLSQCPFCGGLPIVEYDSYRFSIDSSRPGVWRYSSLLPRFQRIVSLGEGLTPIINVDGVLIKNEKVNPTGSYADRASTIIASYITSKGFSNVSIRYEQDFSTSLSRYLHKYAKVVHCIDEPFAIDSSELLKLLGFGDVVTCSSIPQDIPVIEYVNALTVEGLKTIVFEVYEARVDVESIVVPARSGVLAFALAKGVKELRESGIDLTIDIVAVVPKGTEAPKHLTGEELVEIVEVSSNETLEALNTLAKRGVYTSPLSAIAFHVAKTLSKSLAVLTVGFRPRVVARRSELKEQVIKVLKELGKATAYEVWGYISNYSLKGVYKALKSLVKEGVVCEEPVMRGRRKVTLYKPCVEQT
jgi:hypothetical protein